MMTGISRQFRWALLMLTIPAAQAATAQDPAGSAEEAEESTGLRFRLNTGFSHQFDSDIDDGGEFDVTRFGVGGGVAIDLGERLSLDNILSYEFDSYDFSGSSGFGGLDPWDDVHTVRYRPQLTYDVDESWSVFGGPILSFSAEDGADFGNSFTGGAFVGASHRWSETFSASAALVVISQIDDDAIVFPFILLNWKISDDWVLRTGPADLGSSGGGGIELVWSFDDDWQLAFGAQYQSRRFRLDDRGVAPEGVGEVTSVPIYAKLIWSAGSNVSANLFAGVVVGGELRLENDDGNKLSEEDFDPAGVIGARVSIRF